MVMDDRVVMDGVLWLGKSGLDRYRKVQMRSNINGS